jgi:tRNA-Thr(GGU) m(6)t(6)A37 methyltransferase TsaA
MTDARPVPIGLVRSPFKRAEDIPRERNIDPGGFDDIEGTIELFPEYEAGLKDIDGFSHLIVIFEFHQAGPRPAGDGLLVHPPRQTDPRGVFATRSPRRPNPIGLTIVRLLGRAGRVLRVSGLDMVEGTPVLDIKPYTRKDRKSRIKTGWIA